MPGDVDGNEAIDPAGDTVEVAKAALIEGFNIPPC